MYRKVNEHEEAKKIKIRFQSACEARNYSQRTRSRHKSVSSEELIRLFHM